MALRDQPFLPLYVDDFTSDERLAECSAESQGVYIRIMCLMHKSEEYGVILLQQKFKQSEQQVLNFAEKLSIHLPFKTEVIVRALTELVENRVLIIEGDKLLQRRMIRDNSISVKRSEAGSKGGFATAKAQARTPANTVIENVYENVDENCINSCNSNTEKSTTITEQMFDSFRAEFPGTKRGLSTEFENFKKKFKDWKVILPLLRGALSNQIQWRKEMADAGMFVPEWPHLSTWINQRRWEQEKPQIKQKFAPSASKFRELQRLKEIPQGADDIPRMKFKGGS